MRNSIDSADSFISKEEIVYSIDNQRFCHCKRILLTKFEFPTHSECIVGFAASFRLLYACTCLMIASNIFLDLHRNLIW